MEAYESIHQVVRALAEGTPPQRKTAETRIRVSGTAIVLDILDVTYDEVTNTVWVRAEAADDN